MTKKDPLAVVDGILLFFLRLFIGAVVGGLLLLIGMLAGFFTGGGQALFVLVWGIVICTPIWALVPLFRLFRRPKAPPDRPTG